MGDHGAKYSWQKRWVETHSLKDTPYNGRPRGFPSEARVQATALACSLPEAAGVPLTRWNCAELVAKLIALGVVVSIAASTVWRWLKAEAVRRLSSLLAGGLGH